VAKDADTAFNAQLEVISYVEPVNNVVPEPPAFNEKEAVIAYEELTASLDVPNKDAVAFPFKKLELVEFIELFAHDDVISYVELVNNVVNGPVNAKDDDKLDDAHEAESAAIDNKE